MIKTQTYELSGGDGGAYGPIFGPLLADEVSEVDSAGSRYLLLQLHAPIHHKNDQIEYFVVSPRYAGETLKKLRKKGCTVGIGRVLPGKEAELKLNGVTTATVEYWSIGNCTPKQ